MKLNNVILPNPKDFDIDPQKISRTDRTASGRLVEDIIAIKRHFKLRYKGIRHVGLNIFMDVYSSGLPATFAYLDGDKEEIAYVTIRSLPRGIYTELPTVSRDLVITLEEI